MNFTTDTITLMLLRDRIVVFTLLKHQLLLELLFALLLLLQTLVLTLDLQIDLFLFRKAPDLEIAAFATSLQMRWYILKHRIHRKSVHNLMLLAELVTHRQIVISKDLILTA